MANQSPFERVNYVVQVAFSRREVSGSATIEDLMQLTHVALFREFGKDYLTEIGNERISTDQIIKAADRSRDAIRSTEKKRRQRGLPTVQYSAEVPEPSSKKSTYLELRFDIENELRKLTFTERQIMDAKRHDYSTEEIASLVGVSRATVVRTIAKVRQRLARVLELGYLLK
jgi:DNA-directed RNA polymerase specialized sigma24 family protein